MARNEFESEIGKFLSDLFPIAERVDDVAFNRYGGHQVKQKPYDYYGCTDLGAIWVAEIKRVKSSRFPIDNLKEHQIAGLSGVAGVRGNAWLFINWRTGGSRGTGQAAWLTYDYYMGIVGKLGERKSIKPNDIEAGWMLDRIPGGWSCAPAHKGLRGI